MPELDQTFISDLFNIPRNGSNIIDDDEGDDDISVNSKDSRVPFETKAQEIAESISKVAMPVAQKEAAVAKENTEEKPTIDTAVKKIAESNGFDDLFADTKPEAPKVELPKPDKNPTPVVEPKAELEVVKEAQAEPAAHPTKVLVENQNENKADIKAEAPSEPPKKQSMERLTAGGHMWKLTSPSPKYDYFYEEKRSTLSNYLLKDGEIPFEAYYRELGEANVDTEVPTYDAEEVGRRMTEVMKWRDRIKHIQLHTNAQYFVWKLYMDLLPGVLARIEYERGKQEGIIYEHLNDMYGYFGNLEGLFKSCEMVSKHLDAAYASLSRQVAIAQPMQEVERFSNGPRPVVTPQLRKYDGLSQQTSNGGAVGRQKEADSAEPKQKKSVWERM